MATILIRPNERSLIRKITCDCKVPRDCDNEMCHTLTGFYLLGKDAPNYPVPAVLAPCTIDPGMVCIYNVDETVRMAPIVTFYNESWEFPLPSDHKVIDYSKD